MQNRHCTVVSINGFGILIEGQSGSGKTSLALGLLERAEARSLPATFVTDDQAFLESRSGKLIAKAPDEIAGKVEIRGFGILNMPHSDEAPIHLVVKLVPDDTIKRMPDRKTTSLCGMEIPSLDVPIMHEQQSVRIIFAWLAQSS